MSYVTTDQSYALEQNTCLPLCMAFFRAWCRPLPVAQIEAVTPSRARTGSCPPLPNATARFACCCFLVLSIICLMPIRKLLRVSLVMFAGWNES